MAPGPSAHSPSQLPTSECTLSKGQSPACPQKATYAGPPSFSNSMVSKPYSFLGQEKPLAHRESRLCLHVPAGPLSQLLDFDPRAAKGSRWALLPNLQDPTCTHTECLLCSFRVVVCLWPSGCHLVEEKHLTPVLIAPLPRCPPRIWAQKFQGVRRVASHTPHRLLATLALATSLAPR